MNSYTGERVPIIGKQSEGVKNRFQITLLISANTENLAYNLQICGCAWENFNICADENRLLDFVLVLVGGGMRAIMK